MIRYLTAAILIFLPTACSVTGNHNTVRTSLHINVSIVPAVDMEGTRP